MMDPSDLLARNLGDCFDVAGRADKVALIDVADPENPVSLTYGELGSQADALARGLLARGFRRGDRIGILGFNSWRYVVAFLGTMRAGLVTVPISIKLATDIVDYIVQDAALKAVFHDGAHVRLVPEGLPAIALEAGAFDDLLSPGPFTPVRPDPHEVGMMLYTSGSTGRPKGVLLSHASQLWGLAKASELFGDVSANRYIVAAPLYHMNATFSVKMALLGGASFVLMPSFNAAAYLKAVARHRVTWLTSVPTMLALCAREKELFATLDLSSVKRVMMGSAPLTQALIDKVEALFPDAILSNSYGTTEAGPVVFGPHPEGKPRPVISLGYPVDGGAMELREGPSPDEGVLYMRNPSLMEGYHNLPEKTGEALREGWYRSGDIMRRDTDGFYYFVGRADDMFVVGGENVWPGEVEKLLERHEAVHQAMVVPVPDDVKGTLPFAFVVARPGLSVTEEEIKAFALANGPAFAHPRFVEIVSEIPLAATNKPDRSGLTRRAATIAAERRSRGERADKGLA
ncbi:class I adenylate-forming enzyme family protein [Phreatobacter sp.]|uniref:class I adenylate-forming enzyme family protein n=1 Tax=Phreatobacter sp. TaxID=1966341 RepID=UPI003F6F3968